MPMITATGSDSAESNQRERERRTAAITRCKTFQSRRDGIHTHTHTSEQVLYNIIGNILLKDEEKEEEGRR